MKTRDVCQSVIACWVERRGRPGVFVTLCALSLLAGCIKRPTIPEERYQMALKLVDEGTQHLRSRKFEEAKAEFSIASELAPVAAAVDGKGCVALLQGNYAEAEKLFTQAYDLDDTYDQALANLALLNDLMGDTEKALRLYNRYITLYPDSAIVRNNRAVLEYDRGERKILILEELKKAARLSDLGVIKGNVASISEELDTTGTSSEYPSKL